MTCKPESQKQRLERIAVQLMAGMRANPDPRACDLTPEGAAQLAIRDGQALIRQLDALPLDE